LKTLAEFNRSGYHKLLVDITSSEMPQSYTVINSHDLISFLDKTQKEKHIKIAFLRENKEKNQAKFM
jgi:hypothetical protein